MSKQRTPLINKPKSFFARLWSAFSPKKKDDERSISATPQPRGSPETTIRKIQQAAQDSPQFVLNIQDFISVLPKEITERIKALRILLEKSEEAKNADFIIAEILGVTLKTKEFYAPKDSIPLRKLIPESVLHSDEFKFLVLALTDLGTPKKDNFQTSTSTQLHLGFIAGRLCLEVGNNKNDRSLAPSFFMIPAAQGYAPAQYGMAVCYEHGIGITQNPRTALKYYTLAAVSGYEKAVEKVKLAASAAQQNHADEKETPVRKLPNLEIKIPSGSNAKVLVLHSAKEKRESHSSGISATESERSITSMDISSTGSESRSSISNSMSTSSLHDESTSIFYTPTIANKSIPEFFETSEKEEGDPSPSPSSASAKTSKSKKPEQEPAVK